MSRSRTTERSRSLIAAQQLVTDGMAEAVVDHLEVVEVDEQHRDRAGLGAVEAPPELFEEVGPVRQAGQLVVARRPLQVRPRPGAVR